MPPVEMLPPDVQSYISAAVSEGRYGSATEILSEGVRLLQERDRRRAWLKSELAEADAEIDRGECDDIDNEEQLKAFFDSIRDPSPDSSVN